MNFGLSLLNICVLKFSLKTLGYIYANNNKLIIISVKLEMFHEIGFLFGFQVYFSDKILLSNYKYIKFKKSYNTPNYLDIYHIFL